MITQKLSVFLLLVTSIPIAYTRHASQSGNLIFRSGKTSQNPLKIVKNSKICDTRECRSYAASLVNSMNKTVDPCENFYEYTCGRWEASNPLPPYMLLWSPLEMTNHRTQRRLKEIFESKLEPSDILPVRQAKQWYQSCMNTERLEQRGIDPIKSIMMQIGGWPMAIDENKWDETQYTWQDVENHFTRLTGSYTFYDIGVASSTIPNVTLLTVDPPKLPSTGRVGQNLVAKIAKLFGTSNGASIPNDRLSRDVKELELFKKALFKLKHANMSEISIQFDGLKVWYNSNKTNPLLGHPKSNIDWSSMIQNLFNLVDIKVNSSSYVNLQNAGYINGINELLKRTSRRTIVNYIHWNFIDKMWPFTNQNMSETFIFRLWDKIYKRKERVPRWLECVDNMRMRHAAAYAYVEKYFQPNIKSAAMEMVENIRGSLEQNIDSSNWIDPKSKTLLKKKLASIKVFIGFPDWYNKTTITDYYKGITISDEYFENNLSYMRYEKAQDLKLYLSPRPSIDPFITADDEPIKLNAYYNTNLNYAEFPAVDFEPQLFEMGFPNNINYAKIGSFIGHEMGHAFDNCGFLYDSEGEEGQLTDAALSSFHERVNCFIDQYDEYDDNSAVVKGMEWECNDYNNKTNGQRTAGERIADATGLMVAFQAYKKLSKKKNPNGELRLPGLEKFTDDQLFFLSFASSWCEAEASSYTELRPYGVYPVTSRRVLGLLSNLKDFAKAFNCPTDSPMNPSNKCSIWNDSGYGARKNNHTS